MTKPLSKQEKKKRREERKKSQQMQKAPSQTVQKIEVPKAEGAGQTPDPEINLCDTCAYEFGECEGNPSFSDDESNDRVVKCPAFADVDDFPTVDQTNNTAAIVPVAAEKEFEDYAEDYTPVGSEIAQESEPEPSVNKKEIAILEGLPDRPDPKRFINDESDYGSCPGCQRPLKRTAYNRYRDAIRCTNPRCGQYRSVVTTVGTGVK